MKPIASYYDFTGKVVVITGGSRGIGHAMALAFAAAGARVAVAENASGGTPACASARRLCGWCKVAVSGRAACAVPHIKRRFLRSDFSLPIRIQA